MKEDRFTRGGISGQVLQALWGAGGTDVPLPVLMHQSNGTAGEILRAVDELRESQCLIEQTPAGLRLVRVGMGHWREILQHHTGLRRGQLGREVEFFASTASTNDIAWQAAADGRTGTLVVLADEQTAGRGRLGHGWHAKAGQSILMSVLLPGVAGDSLDRLTLLSGLAAAVGIERAICEANGMMPAIEIRWPNDLLVRGRKLAGVLVEARNFSVQGRMRGAAVIGVGINVAQGIDDFPAELRERAVSVFQAAGLLPDRLRIAAAVLGELDESLFSSGGDAPWLAQWKQRCPLLGQRIAARVGRDAISGLVVDVDPLQGLVLRNDHGGTQFLSAQTATLGPI